MNLVVRRDLGGTERPSCALSMTAVMGHVGAGTVERHRGEGRFGGDEGALRATATGWAITFRLCG